MEVRRHHLLSWLFTQWGKEGKGSVSAGEEEVQQEIHGFLDGHEQCRSGTPKPQVPD
jgi:hypothetical protein